MTMRTIQTLILAALVAAGSTVLAADANPKHDPRAAFKETDTNGDGAIDHEEYHVRIVEVFYFADANKDGYLDPNELKALVFADDFTEDDKDANGRVSLREFLRVRFADFGKVDANGDGVLSIDEVVVAWEGKSR
jgi:Ca2+-binding EF-hand superfamily protein